MRNLAVIPARGGSKRMPGKNIKKFLGQPVMAYSIEAALSCKLFEKVMVSTDSEEIAETAKKYGAEVPFLRSSENANDFATLADVLLEVISVFEKQKITYDAICCILPTSPLIQQKHLRQALDLLNNPDITSVCPVVAFSYPILRALEITEKGILKMTWPEHLKTRSQDLKPAYHDSGSFYWIKCQTLINEETLFSKNGTAIILSEEEVQDIDTDTDWKMAELKYKMLFADQA